MIATKRTKAEWLDIGDSFDEIIEYLCPVFSRFLGACGCNDIVERMEGKWEIKLTRL